MIDPHSALIYTMVLVSASDRDMTDSELQTMGDIVKHLPIFRDYDPSRLTETAQECAKLLSDSAGLEKALELIVAGLPKRLHETAYALACDVAAADGRATQEELRLLEMLRHRLDVGRLEAAAIERGARARHATL
ncbi:MAG: tellurite resistance TerB family protein [Kiloniellaceae bacterium]